MTPAHFSRVFAVAVATAVVVAVAACSNDKPVDPRIQAEIAARDAFAKKMLLAEDAGRAFALSSTSDIQFDEGFSMISYFPPEDFRAHAVRWMGQHAHVRLRAHPGKSMKLHLKGWANSSVIRTKPFLSLFIDSEHIGSIGPVEDEYTKGHFWFDLVIPPEKLKREWVDLVIKANAVAFHWADPPTLQVLQIYNFEWSEAP